MENVSRFSGNCFSRLGAQAEFSEVITQIDHERDCLRAAYLDLLAQYRALLTGSLPAIERAKIDDQAALAIAVAVGSRRLAA